MKHLLTLFLFFLMIGNIYCQVFEEVCDTPDEPPLKSAPLLDFIEITNEPIKYVKVNFILLHKNDGTGGFQANNPDHQQYINDMITNLNSIYSNIPYNYDAACYNGAYGIYTDSKIRFNVDVIYLNDSFAWDNENCGTNYCPGDYYYHLDYLNNQIVQNNSNPAINVFFTESQSAYNNIIINQNCPLPNNMGFTSISCSQYPLERNLLLNQQVHMRNKLLKYYWMMNCVVDNNCQNPEWINNPPTEEEVYSWLNIGRGVAHELGHSLDLAHVSNNNCPYCTSHLMMNQSCAWGYFISPLEIAKMHRALSTTSARKYVPDDTFSNTPYSISQNKIWNNDMRIYRGINVNNGAELQILNNLIIPSETEITVTDGSILTIENANVSTPHTNSVLDISFSQNSEISIENSTIANCNINILSSELLIDNSQIELGANGEFVVGVGSEVLITNSSIQ